MLKTKCFWWRRAVVALLLAWLGLAQAQAAITPSAPDQIKLGIYLLSLHDLDPTRASFGADFWIWSNHGNKELQPLKTLEYVNARQSSQSLYATEPKGSTIWSQQKVQGTFRTHWDMRNFPFDRHTLSIFLEEGLTDATRLTYATDTKQSTFSKDIVADGYVLKGLRLSADTRNYDSNFGDPSAEPTSKYAQLRIDIDIERDSMLLFFKMHFAMYAAFLVSAFGFLMIPNIPSMLGTINSLVVGSMFATIINLRATDSVIGRSESFTLVDRLHAVSFAYFVVLGLLAAAVLVTRQRWQDATLHRFKWLAGAVYVISYVIWNVVLILQAEA